MSVTLPSGQSTATESRQLRHFCSYSPAIEGTVVR
jgi:hypothetical protein